MKFVAGLDLKRMDNPQIGLNLIVEHQFFRNLLKSEMDFSTNDFIALFLLYSSLQLRLVEHQRLFILCLIQNTYWHSISFPL